ncbi:LNS2 domain-containing protein [Desulforamulus ruminis]|uniref:Nucleotidase n=1 Tax=Desulforamulus ruminis (strain ATCC 23193 / DSM 2154 / NCIMB 8452 / DL) TaxID=696281 RepID=F6DTV0_DESRL|nr:hypothetical protein [Desulforamulus ruminis]AEG58968.1 hypothetical protein Desru_0683 [Desulforamulus ruminis DSM 2154]
MLIGVDLCNTVTNINYELLQRFNISLKQYPAPEVPKDFFTSAEGLKLFLNARPYTGAQEALFRMAEEGYRVVYMTSRPKLAEFVTRKWLQKHGFPAGSVEFIPGDEKATMARDSGMVAFFDDDPTVIRGLIEKEIPVFVKAAPYNAALSSPNIVRFTDWKQMNSLNQIIKGVTSQC